MGRPQKYTNSPLFLLRNVLGVNQRKFSELIGVSFNLAQQVETGKMPLTQSTFEKVRLSTGAVWNGKAWILDPGLAPLFGLISKDIPYEAKFYDRLRILRTGQLPRNLQIADKRRLVSEFQKLCSETPREQWAHLCQQFSMLKESMNPFSF